MNRDGKIVQSRTPAASQASMIASQRGRVISSGFSTTTCLPARAAWTAGSMWAPLGVQMQTTSRSGLRQHRVQVVEDRAASLGQPGDLVAVGRIAAPGRDDPGVLDLVDRPRVKLGDHAAADDAETVLSHVHRSSTRWSSCRVDDSDQADTRDLRACRRARSSRHATSIRALGSVIGLAARVRC